MVRRNGNDECTSSSRDDAKRIPFTGFFFYLFFFYRVFFVLRLWGRRESKSPIQGTPFTVFRFPMVKPNQVLKMIRGDAEREREREREREKGEGGWAVEMINSAHQGRPERWKVCKASLMNAPSLVSRSRRRRRWSRRGSAPAGASASSIVCAAETRVIYFVIILTWFTFCFFLSSSSSILFFPSEFWSELQID